MTSPETTETSLRATKKEQRRARILKNAIALFRRQGIRATRSASIATASRVSPATLFNYFPTKNDLAESWVRGELRAALEELAQGVGDRGLRSAMRAACRGLAEAACAERTLRLEAWRIAGRAAATDRGPGDAFVRVLTREQERARLRGDLPARVLAEMLCDALEAGLIAGLRESGEAVAVAAELRARVDLVLDGARKRNERVAPPDTAH